MKAPSERELQRIERELKRAPRGAQRAVGGGIYMRLDAGGRRRFQFLRNRNGSAQPGGTYDSWQDAVDALAVREAAAAPAEDGVGGPSAAAILDWEITDYVEKAWWPDVILHLDVLTQLDYSRGWKDLKPQVRGITLRQLQDSPLLIDRIKRAVAAEKTYARKPGEEPTLHKAAADKPLKTLSIICSHAVDRNILIRNPMAGVRRFNRRRSAAGSKDAPSHRPILPSEVKLPTTAALAGSGMRGDPLAILRHRLIPKLIVAGMRPSDILATRNRWWRGEHGPLALMHIDSAVKNLAGHLEEGEPKTGARVLYLFASIAEQLEAIYQVAGCPSLDDLTFPNTRGGLLQWGNWRRSAWYPALDRAEISKGCGADAPGAFYPYVLRLKGSKMEFTLRSRCTRG